MGMTAMKRAISIITFIGALILVAVIEALSHQLQEAAAANLQMPTVGWVAVIAVLVTTMVAGAGLWLVMHYGEQSRPVSVVFIVVGLAVWLASTPPVWSLWALIHPAQFPRTVVPTLSVLAGSLVTVVAGLFATFGVLNLLSPPGSRPRERAAD